MRQLVDAVQNLQYPSSPHTSKPGPLAEPAGAEEDDWPAPPPWPDPLMAGTLPADLPLPPHHSGQRTEELPYVENRAENQRLSLSLRNFGKFLVTGVPFVYMDSVSTREKSIHPSIHFLPLNP